MKHVLTFVLDDEIVRSWIAEYQSQVLRIDGF